MGGIGTSRALDEAVSLYEPPENAKPARR